jgi:hypothetical protein
MNYIEEVRVIDAPPYRDTLSTMEMIMPPETITPVQDNLWRAVRWKRLNCSAEAQSG